MSHPHGRFIVLEGGEGSGKSTQARLLAERLGAVLTHEPGGTDLGRRIREAVLEPGVRITPRAETLLMAADRAEHVAEVVLPALQAGKTVVSDRFSGSTIAYQGHGRGLRSDELAGISAWAAGGVEPDLVVLLDVPLEQALHRALADADPDRMESEDREFHQRVLEGYRAMAAKSPSRWAVVDGTGTVDEVADRVWKAVNR